MLKNLYAKFSDFVRSLTVVLLSHLTIREQSKITLRIVAVELHVHFYKTPVPIPSGPASLWVLRFDNSASMHLMVISIFGIIM